GYIGGEGDDGADVEVAVRPPVETVSDPGCERIVDRRVTQRALDADRRETLRVVEEPGDAHNAVQPQQIERRGWRVEVGATPGDGIAYGLRQRVDVDLESQPKRRARREARADAACAVTGDGFVQAERV